MGPTSQLVVSQTQEVPAESFRENAQPANYDSGPTRPPSAIQPHGMLLVAGAVDRKVLYVSANSERFLYLKPNAILGRPLVDILGSHAAAAVENAHSDADGVPASLRITVSHNDALSFHAFSHRVKGLLYLELEPFVPELRWLQLSKGTEDLIDGLKQASTLNELCQFAAIGVRELTGYDQVMIYRFHEDDHGEVIAEDRDPEIPSLLQYHFPASDIPPQVRARHLQQRTSLIADVGCTPVPVFAVPETVSTQPLDLGYSRLRSVSPAHIRYLRNMGVAATFNIALIHEQRLWGMVLCHHRTPRLMPVELRSLCEVLGQVVSLLTRITESNDRFSEHLAAQGKLDLLGALMPPSLLLAESLARNPEVLLSPVGATGALVRLQGKIRTVGKTPGLEDAIAIMALLREKLSGRLFACDALGEALPQFSRHAEQASGVMLVSVGRSPEDGILWFREEAAKATLWGGNSPEAMSATSGEAHPVPGRSRAAWRQTQFGHARRWTEVDLSVALDFERILTNALALRHADDRPHLSHSDSLTGLPNRRALLDRLALCGDDLWGSSACLIFIDIDRFKMVNDTLGHKTGDDLLIQVAQRLCHSVGSEHMVARLGGDEFVVFCENSGLDDARIIATGIVESFQEPFLLNGKPFRCATSIGLAPANSRGLDSIADILHAADSAMYSAKRRGGNQFVVFENPLHDKLLRQIQLEQDLFQAIERSEISVHYQALVAVENQRLIGFEALLRWKHPVYGHISPGEFIPMAEYTGHIQALGAWVLRDALRQVGRWRLLFNSELFVAVNVSIQQLGNHNFAQIVSAALDEANLPSAALHLEVTESMLMQSATESQLEAIEALGVKIAIDDFGTGYSSLSYLPRLAVSEVKLDRTFLDGVGVDRRKTALFGAIIAMAHTLNLVVVAEGIEEVSQLKCIREHRCDSAQGYLLSKPLAPETVERMLVEEWQEGFVYPALV